MTTCKRLIALMMTCAMLLMIFPQAMAEGRTVYVGTDNAKVYNANGVAVGTVGINTALTLTAVRGNICQVVCGGKVGYMYKGDLAASMVGQAAQAQPAQASTYAVTVYAAKDGAPVYNASGVVIGSVAMNTQMTCTAVKGNVCQVTASGRTAYMKKSDLSQTAVVIPEVTAAPETVQSAVSYTVYAAVDGAKVYSASGAVIGSVAINTQLTCTGVNGNICRVTNMGRVGYMNKAELSESPVAVPAATPTPAPQPTAAPTQAPAQSVTATAYVNKNNARVYNISGSVIGTVGVNTVVTVTAVKGNVCRVTNGGKTAYMLKSDLSSTQVEVAETTDRLAYVAVNGAKVYNAGGAVIGSLPLNTQLTVTATSGSACRVTANGRVGYMKAAELSANPVETQADTQVCATAYVAKDGAKVYNVSGTAIGTLPLNTQLTVTATVNGVCQVTANGKTAYMKAADLSCNPAQQSASVVEIPNTTGYVAREGATVYDADGKAITTLSINTAVTVSAYTDTLCQVVNGSIIGYMAKSDVSTTQVTVANANYTLKFGDSGEAVKRLQTRLKQLGYFNGSIGGNYQSLTQAAVAAFQTVAKLSATGVADSATLTALFSDSAPSKPAVQTAVITADNAATSNGPTSNQSTATPATGTAIEMDWWTSGIQTIFARGTTAVITDVATGLAWREQRRGGSNHADCQPLTAADTAVLKYVYGGTWSWNRRAIFVTINGVNYAASMNGMPHGSGSISGNNFNGHHCIHFTNSRTHGSNKVCSLHQAAIKKALSVSL